MRIAVDVETFENGEPRLDARLFTVGCIYTEKGEEYTFLDREAMWEHILMLGERHKKLYVYGHNHTYDFCSYAKNHLMEVKHIIWQPLFAIKELDNGHTIYFCDTMHLYKTEEKEKSKSLRELGEMCGMPKGEMPTKIKEPMELQEYCMQDCKVTLKAVELLELELAALDMRPAKMITAGQIAMTTWQSFIRNKGLYYGVMRKGEIMRSENWRALRAAFRGGRCQAFQRGEFENCFMLDVHSMYPYIMSTMRFPDLSQSYFVENPEKEDWEMILDCIGVAEVTIEFPQTWIGLLAVWDGKRQKYPCNGQEVRARWTLQEIREATLNGYTIKEIHWAECHFDNDTNPFTEYMKRLYTLKKESKGLRKTAVKLLMNNLYGKFGQRRTSKEILLIDRASYEEEMGSIIGEAGIQYVVEKEGPEIVRGFTNPLISALITAGARIYLYKKMKEIGEEDLLYCDTDSILFKGEKHLKKFKLGDEMGMWEVKDVGDAEIRKGKSYSVGEEVHISGLARSKQSKEALQTKSTRKIMVGLRNALSQGNIELTGSFIEQDFNIQDEEETTIEQIYDETKHYSHLPIKNGKILTEE